MSSILKLHLRIPSLALLCALGAAMSGCGLVDHASKAADQLESAVERLRSGALVRSFNENLKRDRSGLPLSPGTSPTSPYGSDLSWSSSGLLAQDPCPEMTATIAPPGASAAGEVEGELALEPVDPLDSALTEFGNCVRRLKAPYLAADQAIRHFRSFETESGQKPFSAQTDEELNAFFGNNAAGALHRLLMSILTIGREGGQAEGRLRRDFPDADLYELLSLVQRRRQALFDFEAKVCTAVERRAGLFDRYSDVNRYAALRALCRTISDPIGDWTAMELLEALGQVELADSRLVQASKSVLHPWAILALIPESGSEPLPLDPELENPFRVAYSMLENMGGSVETNFELVETYRRLRELDNPSIPEHPLPNADAVRVALIDTGIDFVKYPDLALFLGIGGPGRESELASKDYADDDSNPFAPSEAGLGHGTGTAATFLTMISHLSPETLLERKLDLAMWKIETLRAVLAGPYGDGDLWRNRPLGKQQAILDGITSDGIKPKVVSVSLSFTMGSVLKELGMPSALKASPWLWVMAAGNRGVDLANDRRGCLGDLDPSDRPTDRMLCVGAVKRGILRSSDQIAKYSNYGARVDVYSYESFSEHCAGGTSCSTPAISAAAAILAARFPSLAPEQIRMAILDASEKRTLAFETDPNDIVTRLKRQRGLLPAEVEAKFFDPERMMGKAIEYAVKIAGQVKKTGKSRARPSPRP